jgi:hypothetical protein
MWLPLVQKFQELKFLDLKITSSITAALKISWKMLGIYLSITLIVPRGLMQNSKICEED